MPLFRPCSNLLCVLSLCCVSSQAQNRDVSFPTDEEIKLVLTQADRAIQQYKPLLEMEEEMYGKKGETAVAKDRQVVGALETAIKAFGKNPQAFNGPLGFAFFEWLDDVDRNALLCASGAANEVASDILAGNKGKADVEISLSQSCAAVATLIYTVSENAGALYTRYVEGEEKLAEKGAEVAQKCAETLKQKGAMPKN
jgi:hypothetical protein